MTYEEALERIAFLERLLEEQDEEIRQLNERLREAMQAW